MDNSAIAAVFEELADYSNSMGENRSEFRSLQNGARCDLTFDERIVTSQRTPKRTCAGVGIGKKLAEKSAWLLKPAPCRN